MGQSDAPSGTSLRPAVATDAPALAGLCRQLGYEMDADTLAARLAAVLASPNDRVWVTVDAADTPVGLLHAYGRLALEALPQVTVQALVVHDAWRGRGVGRMLLHAAEAWARERGFAFVGLHSNTRRADARRFYEREGYAVLGESWQFRKALD